MQEKALPPWTSNGSVTARNLGKSKLAGVIFGCKHHTMQECLSEQLFGLLTSSFADQPSIYKRFTVIFSHISLISNGYVMAFKFLNRIASSTFLLRTKYRPWFASVSL